MLATLVIVFREVIEAGLIVGIVLAATKGVSGRGFWVSLGIAAGACWAPASWPCSPARSRGCSRARARRSSTPPSCSPRWSCWPGTMSGWRAMARTWRARCRPWAAPWPPAADRLTALAIVVGVAVLREGSEVVLFLYGIASAGGESAGAMLLGGILGILCGAGLSALMYFGLVAIPMRRLFAVTTALITLLAAGMASQAVVFLQQAGYFSGLADPLWDTIGLLSERQLLGRLSAQPDRLFRQPDGRPAHRLSRDDRRHRRPDAPRAAPGARRPPGPLAKTTPGA